MKKIVISLALINILAVANSHNRVKESSQSDKKEEALLDSYESQEKSTNQAYSTRKRLIELRSAKTQNKIKGR